MIAQEKPRTVKSNGIQNTVSFGIKQEGIAHIFNVLRNQLYTDKVTAVIREYSTNAADAHIEAGYPDRPIEVTLPSRFNLQFKVRDFGPALADSEIHDVYAFYGESTKRNTNSQTGMLGIGSKSAFAYGDNFVINSYIGGKKHTHNAFIDDTQVGQIAKLGEEDTNEEDGLEIVIPVAKGDVDEFSEKTKALFRYFKVQPVVNGKQHEYEQEALYSGNGWRWLNQEASRYSRGEAVVVMGNIGYPIDADQLKFESDSPLPNFACANLVLECPIGDLEISASREGLQYTDLTIKSILKKLNDAADEITEQIAVEFNDCDSLWQAKVLAAELFRYDGKLYSVQHLAKKKVHFNSKPIGEQNVDIDHDTTETGLQVHQYNKSHRGHRKVTGSDAYRIQAGANIKLVWNEESHRRGILKKMVKQVEEENLIPYVFTFNKDVSYSKQKAIIKKLGFIEDDFTMLDTLPAIQLDSQYAYAASGSGNKKHAQKVFSYKGTDGLARWGNAQSAYWSHATVDLSTDKILYVVLERFQYESSGGCSRDSRYLQGDLDSIKDNGLLQSYKKQGEVVVHGIKTKERGKFEKNDNAILLWDALKIEVAKKIESLNVADELANVEALKSVDTSWERLAEYRMKFAKKDSVLVSFLEQVAIAKAQKVAWEATDNKKVKGKLRTFANDLDIELKLGKATLNPKLAEVLYEVYPMLRLVESHLGYYGWSHDEKQKIANVITPIVSYVDMIDKTHSLVG